MSTGLFPSRQERGGPRKGYVPKNVRAKRSPPDWTEEQTNLLCEHIAEGGSFDGAAILLGKNKGAVTSKWQKIKRAMGPQAA